MRAVGIDLAGVESRATGLCLLRDRYVKTLTVYHDDEIVSATVSFNPQIVAIDAPLALPLGKGLNSKGCVRSCDRELWRMGIRFFPINFAGMRRLTERGIRLRLILESRGLKVIETYPGGAQDMLKLPRSRYDPEGLRIMLRKMFKLYGSIDFKLSTHELDAITCAVIGRLHLEGKTLEIGDPKEILMVLPKPGDLIV
jgi:predicted nuclease with RNAse H fold